jgi:hypothetical protein
LYPELVTLGEYKMPAPKQPTLPDARHPYKVFISSTYIDNEDRRKIVQDAITMAGMLWHGMEIFTASTRSTVQECLRYAKEADVLVGIIAWRYGWEPEGQDKSMTEMEYDAAKERLMFQLDQPMDPDKDCDPLPDRWKKQDKLEKFKRRFAQDQMPARFKETNFRAPDLNWKNFSGGPDI